MEFGYWPIKGRAEVMRMLDAYLNLGIKEVNYYSLEEWNHKKSNFGGHFPNLPYLVDGDFVITETEAINQYLAQKAGGWAMMPEKKLKSIN